MGRPMESLKRPRAEGAVLAQHADHRDLRDPARRRKAQALARFLAESTVETESRFGIGERSATCCTASSSRPSEIRAGLQADRDRLGQIGLDEPTAGLEAAMEQADALRAKIQEQVQSAELEIADLEQREKAGERAAEMRGAASQRPGAARGDAQTIARAGPSKRGTGEAIGCPGSASGSIRRRSGKRGRRLWERLKPVCGMRAARAAFAASD